MATTDKVMLFPTQSREPVITMLRTAVQVAVAAFPLFLVVVPLAVSVFVEQAGIAGMDLPGEMFAVLTGIATACTVIATALSRLMAMPAVNQALDRFRLAAGRKDPVPARALDADGDNKPDYI